MSSVLRGMVVMWVSVSDSSRVGESEVTVREYLWGSFSGGYSSVSKIIGGYWC